MDKATTPALNLILSHTKSRAIEVRLAAALWFVYINSYDTYVHRRGCSTTHIIRPQASHHPGTVDQAASLTVIHVINCILSPSSEQPQHRVKACYIICLYLTIIPLGVM